MLTKDLFNKIDGGIKNSNLRKSFNTSKGLLNKLLSPFPKDVMLTALKDSTGIELTFKDLLDKSRTKILIIDFWASWCGPCKDGMPEIYQLKKKFSNSDVELVFISLDEKESNWRSSMQQIKIPGKHYWVDENFKSALGKYLEIHNIPRYVMINRSGKLEKINASFPIPGYQGLGVQISKLLNQ